MNVNMNCLSPSSIGLHIYLKSNYELWYLGLLVSLSVCLSVSPPKGQKKNTKVYKTFLLCSLMKKFFGYNIHRFSKGNLWKNFQQGKSPNKKCHKKCKKAMIFLTHPLGKKVKLKTLKITWKSTETFKGQSLHLHFGKPWKFWLPPPSYQKDQILNFGSFFIFSADSPPLLDFFHFFWHFFYGSPKMMWSKWP